MTDQNAVLSITVRAKDALTGVFRGISKSIVGVGKLFTGLGKLAVSAFSAIAKSAGLLGVAAAGSGIALVLLANNAADAADKVAKASDRLGISERSLQQLTFAADLSGVSFETLTMASQRATRRIAEAAQGTGEAKGALTELGLSARQLAEFNPGDQIVTLLDSLRDVENQSDRIRLAMKLFDSEGVSLVQTIDENAASFSDLADEAERLGGVLGEEQIASLVRYKDAVARIGFAFSGLRNTILAELADPMADLFERGSRALGDFKRDLEVIFSAIDAALIDDSDVSNAMKGALIGIRDATLAAGMEAAKAFTTALVGGLFVFTKELAVPAAASMGKEISIALVRGIFDFAASSLQGTLFDGLAKEAQNAVKMIDLVAGDIGDSIDRIAADTEKAAKTFGDEVTPLIVSEILNMESAADSLRQSWRVALDTMREGLGVERDAGGGTTTTPTDGIGAAEFEDGLQAGADTAAKALVDMKSQGEQAFTSLFGIVQSGYDRIFDGVVDGTLRIGDAMKDMAKSIISEIGKIAAKLATVKILQSLFGVGDTGFGGSQGGGANFFSLLVPGAAIGGMVASAAGSTPIAEFANGGYAPNGGGIVSRPTLFIAGEGKHQEAIVPLPNGRAIEAIVTDPAGGGGGTVINNYYIDAIDAKSFEARLADSSGVIGDISIEKMTQSTKGRQALKRVSGGS